VADHLRPEDGDIWVGQNGQDLWEQAYLVKRGDNYGWSVMEGTIRFICTASRGRRRSSSLSWTPPHRARSLTGGVVYHGKLLPELRGAYIYGDWSTGKIWGVKAP